MSQLILGNTTTNEVSSIVKLKTLDIEAGNQVRTVSYDDAYETTATPAIGGSLYEITTLALYRIKISDGAWVPDGTKDFYLDNGNIAVDLLAEKPATVAIMKTLDLQAGTTVETESYYAYSGTVGAQGGATYQIMTLAQWQAFTGLTTPDGYGDHVLTNGNIAMLLIEDVVNALTYGCVGDGVADDTVKLQAMINRFPGVATIYLPAGTYLYSALTGLDVADINITGDAWNLTTLKCNGSGVALDVGTLSGFRQGINLKGFTVEGNANTTVIVQATAIARSHWDDINVKEAESTAGVGFRFRGCSLNTFKDLVCSTDRQAMTNIPNIGCAIDAQAPFGNSSNNTWTNLYCEGPGRVANTIEIGLQITGGDQNVFIGGSPESCGTYGMTINGNCRYNTFIGMGFENLNATSGDWSDGGESNQFINCYSSEKALFQGRQAKVSGGYYELIEMVGSATRTIIENVTVNNWATGSGGLVDAGVGTLTKSVYDIDATDYLIDIKPNFLNQYPATESNITGNGTAHTLASFTEIFDDNNNVSGGVFTAPTAGRYSLSANVSVDGITTAATMGLIEMVTSNRTYRHERALNAKAGGTQDVFSIDVASADMDAGDTAFVRLTVTGVGADTVDILGNASTAWTTFSGTKV